MAYNLKSYNGLTRELTIGSGFSLKKLNGADEVGKLQLGRIGDGDKVLVSVSELLNSKTMELNRAEMCALIEYLERLIS